ncbi:PREDICTED: probable long-chain-alcohol O-fatty-acyltransferase 1, partial [Tarenaya hassleriana]|uniref:probable long-chain-alcohol O-fatty-acyltransferase 1 n=1 Tax=Tarenaya hassleriana TaxID=28532 RepID=UPI00053C83DE
RTQELLISAVISASYCYYISSKIQSRRVLRLVSLLPVCSLFLVLPLSFSSVHLCVFTTFSLSWLANSKLILFAFDQGPLHPLPQNLLSFFCLCCLPIKPRQHPSPDGSPPLLPKPRRSIVLAIKFVTFSVLLNVYEHKNRLPWILVSGLHAMLIYLDLELGLLFVGSVVSTLLGCEIEPLFNEPYLATSLQDFWSRRWNLMVPATLRTTVHGPVNRATARLVGHDRGPFLGIVASFLVSGLMHELIFYYLTRTLPTWEVTWFFVLHGVCTAAEMAVKRRATWRVHKEISWLLAMGFTVVTGGWLFFPQLVRSHVLERFTSEALLCIDFVTRKLLFI